MLYSFIGTLVISSHNSHKMYMFLQHIHLPVLSRIPVIMQVGSVIAINITLKAKYTPTVKSVPDLTSKPNPFKMHCCNPDFHIVIKLVISFC